MSLFSELKRRNVFRVATAYVVAAWLVIQVAETILPAFGFGDTTLRLVITLLAIAFIPTLILSWVFELTPEGLKREVDVVREHSITQFTGKKLDRIIMALLALALGYFAVDKFVLSEHREATIAAAARQQGRSETLVESYGDRSIAVLPFVNMSADPRQEYFADGMTEELLNLLAKIPDLRVTARTSSFFFKGRNLEVSKIAEALNVTHVLEGSVRRDGDRVRITAQLIEARSDTHLWSETYDRTLESVFAIQDEVAAAIAAQLLDSFTGLSEKPAGQTNNLAAFEAYRTGRLLWWRRSPQDLHKAIEWFEEAIGHDPRFAPAYAALADSWMLLSLYGNIPPLEASRKARPMIDKALTIDPASAEAFAALGLAHWQTGRLDEAESALRHAVELDQIYVPAQLWLGLVLGSQGRYSEQHQVLEQAIMLDPLNELLVVNHAENLSVSGDYASARGELHRLIELHPDSTTLLRSLSLHAMNHGELVAAWKYANRAHEFEPDNPLIIEVLARSWISLGDTGAARRLLDRGLGLAPDNANLQGTYFILLLLEGEFDEAEALLASQMTHGGDEIPEGTPDPVDYELGMLALARGDCAGASQLLGGAITGEISPSLHGREIMIVTLAASADQACGNAELADQRLLMAERALKRARLRGVDDPNVYYTDAAILALKNDKDAALEKLRETYERGFRDYWRLEIDNRFDGLRDEPSFVSLQSLIQHDVGQALIEVRNLPQAGSATGRADSPDEQRPRRAGSSTRK